MSEPAQKCENYAIFKQNYTPELFIALKMVYSCFFGLGEILIFQISSKKGFITSTPELGQTTIWYEQCDQIKIAKCL